MVVTIEVSVLIVAAAVAALLTSVPPALEVEAASAAPTLHSANVDGLFVTFEEVPAGPGTARLIVQARPTIKPPLGPIVGVGVLLVGPSGSVDLPLAGVENGRYEVETPMSAGGWSASVSVRREGRPDAVMRASWVIAPPSSEIVTPFEIVTTALAVLLLAALAFAIHRGRKVRPRPPEPSSSLADDLSVRQP
jgi:hypothetical protein